MLEVLKQLELRRKGRATDFWSTARRLAAGENVPVDAIEKLLTESGKTPAELEAAIELATRRIQWSDQLRKVTALEKEQLSLRERMANENKKLAEAERAHIEATAPLEGRLHAIMIALSEASDARRHLIDTCLDTALCEERALVDRQLSELRRQGIGLRERAELVKQADRDDEESNRIAEGLVPGASTARVDIRREQAARARKVGHSAKAELATVLKEITKLEREEEEICERMTKA